MLTASCRNRPGNDFSFFIFGKIIPYQYAIHNKIAARTYQGQLLILRKRKFETINRDIAAIAGAARYKTWFTPL
jgi:hypothetical protein